jgi:hypothetical protein
MTAQADSFRDWLTREVRDVLRRQAGTPPLLVWCDPDHAWLDLLHAASRADGFELWAPATGDEPEHELLLRDRFHLSPRAPRVVWLPCARDAITWFKPFELEAADVWEKSLLEALREYGVEIPRDEEDELEVLLPAYSLEMLDKPRADWKELTPVNAKSELFNEIKMLDMLAGEPGEFEAVQADGKFDLFARRAMEDFGLPDPRSLDEGAWRLASTARLLATDAAEHSRQDPPREAEKIISPGLARKRALDLLRRWQEHIRFLPGFESLAAKADATTGLAYWARNLRAPPRSMSSLVVEKVLLEQAINRLDGLEDVDSLADELARDIQSWQDRTSGFWESSATKAVGWGHLVELARAAAMLVENRSADAPWRKMADAIDWYCSRGWQLDRAGERLFVESADMPPQLVRIRARLRRGYLRTMERIGRRFSELLASEPQAIFALPTAGELALVELKKPSVPTAILFLDACRYELGWRLAELLNLKEPAPRAHVFAAAAPVPSITQLGMAFALPVERGKITVSLASDDKSFEVRVSGFEGDLKLAQQRRAWLKEAWEAKDWLEIEEVLDGETLKKAGKGRKLIAVHGDEFDAHDGQLKLTGAEEHLQRYLRAIHRLRDHGYSRVIVVTDHGFFHWQPEHDDLEDDKPGGEVRWKHRRAMVGSELSHATAVKLAVPQSELEAVVPRGFSAFRTYGGLGFFHGGATLQELIIPVVVASWPVKARKVTVVLKPVGPITTLVPRVQVQAGSTGQLFSADANLIARRVLVKVKEEATGKLVFRHVEPVAVEPEGQPITVTLSLAQPPPETAFGAKLVVEVSDADDEEVLASEGAVLRTEISEF